MTDAHLVLMQIRNFRGRFWQTWTGIDSRLVAPIGKPLGAFERSGYCEYYGTIDNARKNILKAIQLLLE